MIGGKAIAQPSATNPLILNLQSSAQKSSINPSNLVVTLDSNKSFKFVMSSKLERINNKKGSVGTSGANSPDKAYYSRMSPKIRLRHNELTVVTQVPNAEES